MGEFHSAFCGGGCLCTRRFFRYFFLVQQLIYSFQRSQRRLHGIYHKRHFRQRLCRLIYILEKSLKHSYAHGPRKQHSAAQNGYEYLTQTVDKAYGRVDGVNHEVRLAGCFCQLFRGPVHTVRAFALLIKSLYDDPSAVSLFYQRRHVADPLLSL